MSTGEYTTKDSGVRAEYASGMVRDTQEGKPRFDLIVPLNVPYEHTMLYRDAMLSARGAEKYLPRNNELSGSSEELDRFKDSAFRHFMQWFSGEMDEDHAAAARWNIRQYEELQWRLENGQATSSKQKKEKVNGDSQEAGDGDPEGGSGREDSSEEGCPGGTRCTKECDYY